MSLRTKLLILTAFSLVALLIAFASAYRTARMSQAFAARQAEGDVLAAVRELARDAGNGEEDAVNKPKRRQIPSHEAEIYARFQDAPTRRVALALRARAEVSGGLCAPDGTPQAFVSADSQSASFSADERQIANSACRKTLSDDFQTERINIGGAMYFVASSPVAPDDENTNPIAGAFAFRRVPAEANLFGDWLSLLTQVFLLASAIGLALFSFLVWRDWQSGMRQIESGLQNISNDLSARIEPPSTFELQEVSRSINDLATNLEANLRREAELEKSLARNEKLASLGRVAAGVAHEVRNPLASMKLKIQLAGRSDYEKSKLEKTFGVLLEEIERLDNLVRRLLDLSRPPKLDLSKISLAGLIDERLALLSDKFAQAGVQIEFEDAARQNLSIAADREKLAQIFDNLFLNALEAMPEGGLLRVEIDEKTEKIEIKISDTGEEIAADKREKIFEPFFTTKDTGTGLGLAISREIAESHGGRLFLDESPKGDTIFVVELPLSG
ncbi:MAG TPA: ATP-binding protein [Pyrinomonadaceae bacterium]